MYNLVNNYKADTSLLLQLRSGNRNCPPPLVAITITAPFALSFNYTYDKRTVGNYANNFAKEYLHISD